ncbi:MAG: UbiA family prenyltransferase [Methanomassiliicoccales archaeon]|nr:UbiA family prenyltransferase [Methanomassiliicoccales archaeon]
MMDKVRALAGLMKPELPIFAGVCVIIGEALALGRIPDAFPVVIGFLIGLLISAAEMVSNDYFDLEVDKVNHPERPLPSGQVSSKEAIFFTAFLSAMGLLASALLGPLVLVFTALIWALGMLYNWKLKSTGLPGNMLVALSVAMTFVLGGMIVDRSESGLVWTFALMAFVFDLAEEISGGIRDAEGDGLIGSRSLARVHGRTFAMYCVSFLFAIFIAASALPYIFGWLGSYYLVLILTADLIITVLVAKLWKAKTPEEGRGVQRALYLTLMFFIIMILLISLL